MPPASQRKISETILDFGHPLPDKLEADPSVDTAKAMQKTVALVRNSHVMAMPPWGQPKFLEELHRMLADPEMPPEVGQRSGRCPGGAQSSSPRTRGPSARGTWA
jgi:hypothetical protein